MNRTTGVLIICVSAFTSFILSVSSKIEGGMGGLVNFFYPIFTGVLSIIFFLIFFPAFEKEKGKIVFLVILCFYNIYVGLALRLDIDFGLIRY